SLVIAMPAKALSQLQSQVDKNPAMFGEAITLEVTADARLAADALHFRMLDADFMVMAPAVSQSSRIINGQASHSTTWTVVLMPRQSGRFTLPAFSINNISTAPIELEVLPASSKPAERQQLFLKATISSSTDIYVQQLIYYDVTIYYSGDLQRGNLTEPQLEGADIQRVGQDTEGNELIDGVRYRTFNRRYSITPQRSGDFTITPPVFSGEIIERDSGRYNPFARSTTVMQQAQPLNIKVLPQPDNFSGSWLVAGLVTLTEEWQPQTDTITAGEPITRIITLSAVDISANQLPELEQRFPAGVRLYQETPQTKAAERSNRQVAQKIYTTALIAEQAGELVLPEIQLPWWNSQTQQVNYATLPGRTLTVTASTSQSATSAAGTSAVFTAPQPATGNAWQWSHTSSLLLALWLLTLLLWAWQAKRRPAITNPTAVNHSAAVPSLSKQFARQLQQACDNNDKQQAKQLLLAWGQKQFGLPVPSLEALTLQLQTPALQHEIHLLNAALYATTANPWQGANLYHQWKQWQAPQQKSEREVLPPLYPG
uniref:BatD family protein n=1 Tax=Arsukibacterium sp. TaxID=1977258 RepID=UPI002FD9D707